MYAASGVNGVSGAMYALNDETHARRVMLRYVAWRSLHLKSSVCHNRQQSPSDQELGADSRHYTLSFRAVQPHLHSGNLVHASNTQIRLCPYPLSCHHTYLLGHQGWRLSASHPLVILSSFFSLICSEIA